MDEQLSTDFLLNLGRYMERQLEKHGETDEAYRLEDGSEMSPEMKMTAMRAVEAWGLYNMQNELKDRE